MDTNTGIAAAVVVIVLSLLLLGCNSGEERTEEEQPPQVERLEKIDPLPLMQVTPPAYDKKAIWSELPVLVMPTIGTNPEDLGKAGEGEKKIFQRLSSPPVAPPTPEVKPPTVVISRTPGQPLLRYRETSPGPRWLSDRGSSYMFRVADSSFAPAVTVGDWERVSDWRKNNFHGRSMLLSVGARWCVPCIRELGDLFELATDLHKDVDARFVIVLAEDRASSRHGLKNSLDEMIYEHAQTRADAVEAPTWTKVWGDPGLLWLRMVEHFFAGSLRKNGVPLTMLFDHCGDIHIAVQGVLDDPTTELIQARAAGFSRNAPCN